jgi:hypothetical protein
MLKLLILNFSPASLSGSVILLSTQYFYIFNLCYSPKGVHGKHNWLSHYATSQKVVGSVPNKVTGVLPFI